MLVGVVNLEIFITIWKLAIWVVEKSRDDNFLNTELYAQKINARGFEHLFGYRMIENSIKFWEFSQLLAGVLSWTVEKPERKRTEACRMKCYKRVLGIKWIDSVRNEEVRKRICKRMDIWNCLKGSRDKLVRYNLKHLRIIWPLLKEMVERGKLGEKLEINYWGYVNCGSYLEMEVLA